MNKAERNILYYTLPLYGIQISSKAFTMNHLYKRFLKWCKKNNITEIECLALWHAGSGSKTENNTDNIFEEAEIAFEKLPEGLKTIELEEEK